MKVNNAVQFIVEILEEFKTKVEKFTMTVQEYFFLKRCMMEQSSQVTIFIEILYSVPSDFDDKWKSFNDNFKEAESKYKVYRLLYRNILVPVKHVIEIADLKPVKQKLCDMKTKFDSNSCIPFCELNKFLGLLGEFLFVNPMLHPLCNLNTFLTLCRAVLSSFGETENDSEDDEVESSLPALFSEEKSRVHTSLHVLKFIERKCIPMYEQWLKEVAVNSTLDAIMRYVGNDDTDICEEIKEGSQLFDIKISSEVLSSLDWLKRFE